MFSNYSTGNRLMLLVLFVFLLAGIGYTIHDYATNGDLSPLVWVGICLLLIGLLLWLGRPGAPDGGFMLLPLLLALGAAASCARPAAESPQLTYTDARGFEVPVQTTADSVRARW